ncbi:MAG: BrnT family toxin [Acidobacteriota bacterium]
MDIEWDPRKATSNLIKHGVDFADAATVFEDELGRTIPDEESGEQRFITMGTDALGRILVVV